MSGDSNSRLTLQQPNWVIQGKCSPDEAPNDSIFYSVNGKGLGRRITSKSKIIILNINEYEHFKLPEKRDTHLGQSREDCPDGVTGVVLGRKCGAGYKSLGKGREHWSKHVPWDDLRKGSEVG